MLIESALPQYFKFLTLLGLTPIHVNKDNMITANPKDEWICKISFFVIQSVMAFVLIMNILKFKEQYFNQESSLTDFFIDFFQYSMNVVIHMIVQSWFFSYNKEHFRLIKAIWSFGNRFQDKASQSMVLKNIKILYATTLYCIINMTVMVTIYNDYVNGLPFLFHLTAVTIVISFTVSTVILSFYIVLIGKIQMILRSMNS